jgi:hypothetical protein
MRLAARLLCLFPISALLAGPAAAGDALFDPGRVRWTALEFDASKLLMSARAEVTARIVPAGAVAGQLVTTPAGAALLPAHDVLEMTYRTSGLGRASTATLWANPGTGAMLQQVTLDTSGRLRERTYRFTDIGAYHYTRRPAERREEALPPATWTELSEGMRTYPEDVGGQPVTAPTVLLWLAAAADLSRRGDQLEVMAFSRRHVNRVTIEVTGTRTVSVDFTEQRAAEEPRRRRGNMQAIALRINGSPTDATAEDEPFELLGLQGDLELLLDPATRAPLQLRGRVRIAGDVTVRLRKATLR